MLRRRGRLPGDLPTTMGSAELGANIFQRTQTAEMVRQRDLQGLPPITAMAREVGQAIRRTIAEMDGIMPENLPQYPPLPPGEWMPPDHPSRIQWDAPDDDTDPPTPSLPSPVE